MTTYLTIADAAAALRSGETTSVALTQACLAAADRLDSTIGTFIARFDEAATAAAAKADEEIAAGVDRGPLHGIPLGIKDIISTADGPTTAQSLILDPAWGAGIGDAVVVARLRAAGAVLVGKATTYEFAIGVPDPDKPFPIPRNPWDLTRTPGGSSSGTGNGIAAGMFLGGLGTDTGGSVRWPAALCGISGIKQTFGRVPKSGCTSLGYSLDNIGPMARSAYDCALMLGVMAGFDASDPCTVDVPVPDYAAGLTGSLAGVRIGLDLLEDAAASRDPVLSERMRAAADVLAAAGAEIVPVSVPLYQELTDACQLTMMAEALAYQRGDLAARWEDYGRATRATLAQGIFVTGADYTQMQRVRRVGQRRMAELFEQVDLVLTPSTSSGALKLDDLDFRTIIGHVMTPIWNAVGNPALCVPIGFGSEGTPLSMQLAGRPFDETAVFNAGHTYQLATDWHLRVAPLVAGEPALA